jgi:hypothetical protein
MTPKRRVLFPLLLAAVVLPGVCAAQEVPAGGVEREGLVVQVLEDRVIVDIGSAQGVLPGDAARIVSTVQARHPATGAPLRDRVVLGASRVGQVGEAMCQVPLGAVDAAQVKIGDVVLITVGGRADDAVPEGGAASGAPARSVGAVAPPSQEPSQAAPRPKARPRSRVAHEPLQDLVEGRPAMVTVVAVGMDLSEATLHVRVDRSGAYREVAMARTGDAGWTATLDAAAVKAPRLEYYVDGRTDDGRAVPLFRSVSKPWAVAIREGTQARMPRARIGGAFEWQEFYMARPGRDAFWRASVDFAYRLDKGALHELRGGVAALEGIGGSRWAVEDGDALDHRALAWLYFEPVLRFGEWVRMYPRVMIGGFAKFVDPDYEEWADEPERGSAMFGTSLHLEIGREHGFVFRTGGTVLQGVGTELDAQATFQPVRGVPIGVAVSATNFPVGDEWGARVQLLAGYRALDWLAIDVRLGANVRSTRHAGVGGGLGLSFAW